MSEDYFYNKKRIDDLEEGKIVAIDRLKGRVSLYLRNGLVSTGTYLYDIKNLREGMSVLIGRVSNSYVIINEVKGIPKESVASCKSKTSTMDWSAFYTASGATAVKRAARINNKLLAVGNNGEKMYTEDPTGGSGWNTLCGGAHIGNIPENPLVNVTYELTIESGDSSPFGPLYMVKVSGEGTFEDNYYTPRIPALGCTGQDVIELRTSLEIQETYTEGDPPVDHTEDENYEVCQTLNSDVNVTATCGNATIGYVGSLTLKPGETTTFSIEGAETHVGALTLYMEEGGNGSFVNGVYTASLATDDCMGSATIKLKSVSSETCFTACDSVEIEVDGQPKCNGATIGFTTQQMAVGESQTLTIIEGETPPYGTMRFNLWSGGGSFSENTYTAAAENPDCVNNAGIQLLCEIDGCSPEICDTLNISVNAVLGDDPAGFDRIAKSEQCEYWPSGCGETWWCLSTCWDRYFKCDGTVLSQNSTSLAGPYCVGCGCAAANCPIPFEDRRTPAMIAAGCCPEQLL